MSTINGCKSLPSEKRPKSFFYTRKCAFQPESFKLKSDLDLLDNGPRCKGRSGCNELLAPFPCSCVNSKLIRLLVSRISRPIRSFPLSFWRVRVWIYSARRSQSWRAFLWLQRPSQSANRSYPPRRRLCRIVCGL